MSRGATFQCPSNRRFQHSVAAHGHTSELRGRPGCPREHCGRDCRQRYIRGDTIDNFQYLMSTPYWKIFESVRRRCMPQSRLHERLFGFHLDSMSIPFGFHSDPISILIEFNLDPIWIPFGYHSVWIRVGLHPGSVRIPVVGAHLGSAWVTCGFQMDFIWTPVELHSESTSVPVRFHMDSNWITSGFQFDSTWVSVGLQVEPSWIPFGYYSVSI